MSVFQLKLKFQILDIVSFQASILGVVVVILVHEYRKSKAESEQVSTWGITNQTRIMFISGFRWKQSRGWRGRRSGRGSLTSRPSLKGTLSRSGILSEASSGEKVVFFCGPGWKSPEQQFRNSDKERRLPKELRDSLAEKPLEVRRIVMLEDDLERDAVTLNSSTKSPTTKSEKKTMSEDLEELWEEVVEEILDTVNPEEDD